MMEGKRNRKLFICSAFLLLLLLGQPLLRRLERHDPYETNLSLALLPPASKGYLFGTDNLGRCVLCRILEGGQISIYSAVAVVVLSLLIGTTVGVLAGYCGGWIDAGLMKITTIFQAFPSMILAIAVAGILGHELKYGIWALVAVYWTSYARYARSMVLVLRDADYIKAAKLCGANHISIMIKHMFSAVLGKMIIMASMDIGSVIISMSTLSFLGLGAKRPTAEWGAMMSEAKDYMQVCPWPVVFVGIVLFFVILLFNFEGDFLRDYIDITNDKEY